MALIKATILRNYPRRSIFVHTRSEEKSNYEIWVESADKTYFEKIPQSDFHAQDLRMAEWDMMHGRPNPLADELALYPLTALDPLSLTKRKNK